MLIVRVCLVVVGAALIFAMSKWQASEKKKTDPRKAVLLVTKGVNLLCATLIAISVVGQIVDLTSGNIQFDRTTNNHHLDETVFDTSVPATVQKETKKPVLTVGEIRTLNQRRYASIDIRLPDSMSVTKEATLLAIVGVTEPQGAADQYGPPQSFALKGTSHQITAHHFCVSVALPPKKVAVRFILRDRDVLHDETREM